MLLRCQLLFQHSQPSCRADASPTTDVSCVLCPHDRLLRDDADDSLRKALCQPAGSQLQWSWFARTQELGV